MAATLHKRSPPFRQRLRGFTLIELLVALSVMAVLAVLSWRGLDGMARSQAQTSQRSDEILSLQAGLAQWKADLNAITEPPGLQGLDWDGRVLRVTRRSIAGNDGVIVVAWTRRDENGGKWLRWQSPVVRNLGGWSEAWQQAEVWAQTPSEKDRALEVFIAPLQEWQLVYFRGNAWTNPLSSGAPTGVGRTALPEGIRLMLVLPPGQAISGKLVVDWVR